MPAFDVPIVIAPLDVFTPSPLVTPMAPPVLTVLSPDAMVMRPPTPLLPLPTVMLTAPASAQMGGPVSLEYTAYPTSRSQDLPENVEPAETRVQNIALSLGVPIQFKSSGTLLFPSFKYNALLLDRRPELDPQLNALHNPALQLVVLQNFGPIGVDGDVLGCRGEGDYRGPEHGPHARGLGITGGEAS